MKVGLDLFLMNKVSSDLPVLIVSVTCMNNNCRKKREKAGGDTIKQLHIEEDI